MTMAVAIHRGARGWQSRHERSGRHERLCSCACVEFREDGGLKTERQKKSFQFTFAFGFRYAVGFLNTVIAWLSSGSTMRTPTSLRILA